MSRIQNNSNIQQVQNLDIATEQTHPRQTDANSNGFRVDANDLSSVTNKLVQLAVPSGLAPAVDALTQQTVGGTNPLGTGGANHTSDMERIQADGFRNSTYLIGLQQQIQDENRQFTTVTNVIRAKHDTAKAALANIRS